MSNQVEQIRAEVERRIKSWQAGIKYEGDAGDCQSRVTELTDLKKFIDSLPAEENPILVPEPKETTIEAERPIQGSIAPEADLEAEIERYESVIYGFEGSSRADCLNIARHFAEWGAEHLKR